MCSMNESVFCVLWNLAGSSVLSLMTNVTALLSLLFFISFELCLFFFQIKMVLIWVPEESE